jgi:histone-binding protein RBBP4
MDDSYSEEDYNLDKIINEEFKVWKKNTPYLYDLVVMKALEWPSLTLDWFPTKTMEEGFASYSILLGTHTNPQDGKEYEQNYLMTANVKLPTENTSLLDQVYLNASKVEIKQFINHPGEVNRARIHPLKHNLVASKTIGAEILLFDLTNHSNTKPKHNKVKAELTLEGHSKREGNSYGLSWNVLKPNQLISGGDDSLICSWDVDGTGTNGKLGCSQTYKFHKDVVEDVSWHPMHESIFGSVGDDKLFILWDSRKKSDSPLAVIEAHSDNVNCLSFNPYDGVYCVTGSSDKTLSLWDIRNLKSAIHNFENHVGEVHQVQWAPFNSNIFASGGTDRRICVWDVSQVGVEIKSEVKDQEPPELLFIHGGHTGKITDLAWCPKEPWVCGSVSDDNILQIWQIAKQIVDS